MDSLLNLAAPDVKLQKLDINDGVLLFEELEESKNRTDCTEEEAKLKKLADESCAVPVLSDGSSLCDPIHYSKGETVEHRSQADGQGWQAPGPGAPAGSGRNIRASDLV